MSVDAPHVINHPVIDHHLSVMRDQDTDTEHFRLALRRVGYLLAYEVFRNLPTELRTIKTPLRQIDAPFLSGKPPVLVSVLRAGLGMVDGMLDFLPSAEQGHVGLARDPVTLKASQYYFKLPRNLEDRRVVVVDPMLATANSSIDATTRIKEAGARHLDFVCLLASPEGVERYGQAHPDVPITTAAIDDCLNDHGYIVPGLGDAGDRQFGT